MVYGTDIGHWYPANHWALMRMASVYTRRAGPAWLSQMVGAVSVIDRLREHAYHWRNYAGSDGLARHPESDLLEVVCDYRGAVPGINANHAQGMLLFADLLDQFGAGDEALVVRKDAQVLIDAIVTHLWDSEQKTFVCIHPDGKRRSSLSCL